MKKLLPILAILVAVCTACSMGGAQAEPTPLALPTAVPTLTPVPLNPTQQADQNVQAGNERVSPVDGMMQVYVPEGTFRMGGLDPNASMDEKPDRKVTVKGFWFDKLEVTNAMYMLCVQAGACEPPDGFNSETQQQYFNNSQFNDYPVVYVTWGDAETYCKWAGRRLPSEAEWEYTARGTDLRTYPWGDERPDSTRSNFNYYLRDTSRVGSFPAGASPFGALDMAGNVWEWVSDFYDPGYYGSALSINPTGPAAPVGAESYYRSLRGGSFKDADIEIRVANRSRASGPNPNAQLDSPEYFGESFKNVGFRCASDN